MSYDPTCASGSSLSDITSKLGAAKAWIEAVEADIAALQAEAAKRQEGNGAPSASSANGTIYIRLDATLLQPKLYLRLGGAWLPLSATAL